VQSVPLMASTTRRTRKPGSFGEFMRERRQELGLSLDQLSFRCGIGVRLLGAYERGEHQPGAKTLTAIMVSLDAELPWQTDSGDSSTARESSFPDWGRVRSLYDLAPVFVAR